MKSKFFIDPEHWAQLSKSEKMWFTNKSTSNAQKLEFIEKVRVQYDEFLKSQGEQKQKIEVMEKEKKTYCEVLSHELPKVSFWNNFFS